MAEVLVELEEAEAALSSVAPSDLALLAYFLRSLESSEGRTAERLPGVGGDECSVLAGKLVGDRVRINTVVAAFAGGLIGYGIAGPIGGVVGAVLLGKLFLGVKEYNDTQEQVLDTCLEPFFLLFDGNDFDGGGAHAQRALAPPPSSTSAFVRDASDRNGAAQRLAAQRSTTGGLTFTHGEAEPLQVRTDYEVVDYLQEACSAFVGSLSGVLSLLPASWVEGLYAYAQPVTEEGPPEGLRLGTISPSGITGTMSVSGEQLDMTFEFQDESFPSDEGQTFTFELEESSAGFRSSFEAYLMVPDSTSIYEEAVLGFWTADSYENPSGRYRLEIMESGVGRYLVIPNEPPTTPCPGAHGMIDGRCVYPMSWWIYRSMDGRYQMMDSGFWHPAFEGEDRDPLTLPATRFTTYSGLLNGAPSRVFIKQ